MSAETPEKFGLDQALLTLETFASAGGLTGRIADLEQAFASKSRSDIVTLLQHEAIDETVLAAALAVKRVAGEINVIVHAVGVLTALPYVLEEGERVESLSLGAGNTGRLHDLETDRQIAEFKFINWRGGTEPVRQNTLFFDLFRLASSPTTKRRVLYVVGKTIPLRFLNNRRALNSVLTNATVAARFRSLHGDRFATVRDYFATVRELVEVIDLAEFVPTFRASLGHAGS
jgi:hypothetical protein